MPGKNSSGNSLLSSPSLSVGSSLPRRPRCHNPHLSLDEDGNDDEDDVVLFEGNKSTEKPIFSLWGVQTVIRLSVCPQRSCLEGGSSLRQTFHLCDFFPCVRRVLCDITGASPSSVLAQKMSCLSQNPSPSLILAPTPRKLS